MSALSGLPKVLTGGQNTTGIAALAHSVAKRHAALVTPPRPSAILMVVQWS